MYTVYTKYIVLGRIANPGGFYPDPTFEEISDPDRTLGKKVCLVPDPV